MTMLRIGRPLLLGASLLALTPAAAFAQDAAPAPAAAASGSDAIGEIVVTAQRRSESMQRIPLSIQVVSDEALRKAAVSQVTDLSRITPGVQIAMGGTATQVYIRGAGTPTTTPLSDPAVSLNIDGVYVARSQAFNGQFYDVERVEILKGPQGTLYGRNSSGGALNLLAAAPKLDQTSGYVQFGLQSHMGGSAEAAVNVPLGETLALRASGQIVSREGYLSDGTDDDVHQSARLQLLYKPSSVFSLRLWGNYQHLGGKGPGATPYNPNPVATPAALISGGVGNAPTLSTTSITIPTPSDPWTSVVPTLQAALGNNTGNCGAGHSPWAGAACTATLGGVRPLRVIDPYQDINAWNIHAQADIHLGFGTLTVIPAYQKVTMRATNYPGIMYSTVSALTGDGQVSKAKSVEARLSDNGNIARFTYTLGFFWYDENQTNSSTVDLGFAPPGPQAIAYSALLKTKDYAAFGQATYELFDGFKLIGGLRYTHEQRDVVNGQQYTLASIVPVASCVGIAPIANAATKIAPDGSTCYSSLNLNTTLNTSRVNYRAGFEYQVTPQNMVYATVSTGFKSGGQTVALLPPYKPEGITAYTVGTKNRFFGGRLQANLELFWWDYTNKQESLQQLDQNGRSASAIINAGSATSKGVSLELLGKVTPHDTLTFNAEYNHARYKNFNWTAWSALPSTGCSVGIQVAATTSPVTPTNWPVSCSGMQMTRSPDWTGSAGYTHTFDLANGGHIDLGANTTFSSSRYVSVSFVPNSHVGGYALVNANLTYTAPEGHWSLDLFATNLTNKAVYTGGDQSQVIGGFFAATIAPPRVVGGRFRFNF